MAQIFSEMGNSSEANEYLKRIANEISKNPPEDKNGGHNALMQDLAELCEEAFHYEFHDFRNKKYATPKAELKTRLVIIAQNVVNGKYDN